LNPIALRRRATMGKTNPKPVFRDTGMPGTFGKRTSGDYNATDYCVELSAHLAVRDKRAPAPSDAAWKVPAPSVEFWNASVARALPLLPVICKSPLAAE
jgi:hypothetical protein